MGKFVHYSLLFFTLTIDILFIETYFFSIENPLFAVHLEASDLKTKTIMYQNSNGKVSELCIIVYANRFKLCKGMGVNCR